jgi:hypothetical protein
MAATSELAAAAAREVVDLHVWLEDWLGGLRPKAALEADRLARSLGDGFVIISPDGSRASRAETLAGIGGAYGTRGNPADPFRIWITEVDILMEAGGLVAVGYIENQHQDGRHTARRSSAVFDAVTGAPYGVVWRLLHETWINGRTGA